VVNTERRIAERDDGPISAPIWSGLEVGGVDRVDRSSSGKDALYLIRSTGNDLEGESDHDRLLGSVPDLLTNWSAMASITC